ncbi:GcvH Glycine cleavage system H protein (lipoate-binding) [Burkholderiales bacterium]
MRWAPSCQPLEAVVQFPQDLRYTESHEWAKLDSGEITVGITELAQDSLGELVYVELPTMGRIVSAGEACAVVESTKAASDVYAPIAGEVVAVNDALSSEPQLVNEAPYAGGWLFKIRPSQPDPLSALLSVEAYTAGPGKGA